MNDWKLRLGALEAEVSERTWQKLEQRLHTSQKRSLPYWFWPVAACFLIFSFVLSFYKTPHLREDNAQTPTKNILFLKDDIMLTKSSSHISVKKQKSNKKKLYTPLFVVKTDRPMDTVKSLFISTITPPALKTEPEVVALPVIHINELNKRSQQKEMMATNSNESNHARRMTVTNNSSDDILKINLSPSN